MKLPGYSIKSFYCGDGGIRRKLLIRFAHKYLLPRLGAQTSGAPAAFEPLRSHRELFLPAKAGIKTPGGDGGIRTREGY